MRWGRGAVGEGRGAGLRSWAELRKSLEMNCRSRVNHFPQRREALAPGIFSPEPSFSLPSASPAQRSRGTKDECKPVVMEMPVAPRSASALGSPQALFRFRRFGTDTMILLSSRVPTNGAHQRRHWPWLWRY